LSDLKLKTEVEVSTCISYRVQYWTTAGDCYFS